MNTRLNIKIYYSELISIKNKKNLSKNLNRIVLPKFSSKAFSFHLKRG
jgi:hypothetical protein